MRRQLSGLGFLILLIVIWEAASRLSLVHPVYIPPFSRVMQTWWELMVSGELPRQVWDSMGRFLLGYVLAVVAGVALGMFMGSSRWLYALLEPTVELLRPLPPPAIIPVAILLLGIEDTMKVFVIAFSCFFPVLVNTIHGVQGVERVLIDTARTFRLRSREIIWKVTLPAAAPSIVTGMRISLAIALILTVITEMVAANSGIGYFILDSERSFRVREMYAGILMLMLLGYLLNRAFVWIEAHSMRWYYQRNLGET